MTGLNRALIARPLPCASNDSVVRVFSGGRVAVRANCELDQSLTAWVPLLTPIAMARGCRLELDGEVAESALQAGRSAQAVLAGWYPGLREIEVVASRVAQPRRPRADGVGAFFSGGVDSFYSLLEHADEITHLIFVSGFDIGLHKADLTSRTLEAVREVAAASGKELVEIRTNLRRLSNRYLDWGRQYHGSALAGIAQLLSPHLGRVLVPATFADDHAWGSHPLLDPAWSSEVEVVHDLPLPRVQKLARVAESDLAMRWLRVCYSADDSEYNCGHCEKCLRTMISLRALGRLSRAATLPHKIDPRLVRGLRLKGAGKVFAEENLATLRAMPHRDRGLERALATALRLAPWHAFVRRTVRRYESGLQRGRGFVVRCRAALSRRWRRVAGGRRGLLSRPGSS